MKGFLIPGLFAMAIIMIAAAVSPSLRCGSMHGPRIADAVLIAECP